MSRVLLLPFALAAPLHRLAALAGIRVITRERIVGDDLRRYGEAGAKPWIAAHEVLKQALDGVHHELTHAPASAITAAWGIDADRLAHRLTQQINISFGFDVLFLLTAQNCFGGEMVLPAPAAFRRQLEQAGMRCHRRWSALAWAWRRLTLQLGGLLAHLVHAVQAGNDEWRPARLPDWARTGELAVWPATDPGAFATTPERLSMGDFFLTKAIAPFRDCDVLLVANAQGQPKPPVVSIRHILAGRRGTGGNVKAALAALWRQLPVTAALLRGGWRDVLLARETALLPRASLFVAETRPRWLIGGLPNIANPNLWYELARNAGSQLYIVCNSAQVTSIFRNDEMMAGHVPHIYMHPVADCFGAWSPTHAQALARFGIAADSIEIAGPMIYSARPPRQRRPIAGRRLMIDYFDQVPYRAPPLQPSGVPSMYWTTDRLIRTVRDIVSTLSQALPADSFRLRIKSKKVLPHLDSGYFAALEAMATEFPAIQLVDWRTSALALNADSDLTISFPFASTSVSAHWYGVPACYYDVDGLAAVDPLITDTLPVLVGPEALTHWIAAQYRLLSEHQESASP